MKENFQAKYIFRGVLFASLFLIFGTYVGMEIPWGNKFLEGFYKFLIIIGFIGLLIHTMWEADLRTPEEYEQLLKGRFLPIKFPGRITTLIVFVILAHRLFLGGVDMKRIHNSSTTYHKQYDLTWKTFKQQSELAGINKDGLIQLTQIAFEARKDAGNLAWKWTVENQPLPFDQFTQIYYNLSKFVEDRRREMYELERERQSIAKNNNTLLDVFPNNLYNVLLGEGHIRYKYGVLSDSTNTVVETGVENLK